MYRAGSGLWRIGAGGPATKPAAAGPWTPLSLGATLKGWWDFSDPTALFTDAGVTQVSADGQAIYQANDKSGNSRHLTQATAGNRPLYKTGILNGLSVAQFGGATDDDYLDAAGSGAGLTAFTVVSVGRFANFVNDSASPTAVLTATGTYDYISGCVQVEDQVWLTSTNIISFTAPTPGTWYIMARRHGQGTHNIYRNGGAALGTGNKTGWSFAWNVLRLGARYSALAPALDGSEGELVVCDSYLSDANLNLLGAYLADKWALTWTGV